MVQQLLFAIADQRKVEPDNMVLNETQEEHFDYHREDFRGGRGAHTESDKQESAVGQWILGQQLLSQWILDQ